MYLILFDFDGTLVDSQHSIVESMEMAFKAHDLPVPCRQDIVSVVGLSLEQAIWCLHKEASMPLISSLVTSYKEAFQTILKRQKHQEPLYDGAFELLRDLAKQEDIFLGIATGKSRKGLIRVLEQHNLTDYFQTLQTADDARSKPHPEMIDRALCETGIDKSNTVMIGDTSFDMEMGKLAKITPIGVSWGYHPVERLKETGAEFIVNDFRELQSTLTHFCEKREAV